MKSLNPKNEFRRVNRKNQRNGELTQARYLHYTPMHPVVVSQVKGAILRFYDACNKNGFANLNQYWSYNGQASLYNPRNQSFKSSLIAGNGTVDFGDRNRYDISTGKETSVVIGNLLTVVNFRTVVNSNLIASSYLAYGTRNNTRVSSNGLFGYASWSTNSSIRDIVGYTINFTSRTRSTTTEIYKTVGTEKLPAVDSPLGQNIWRIRQGIYLVAEQLNFEMFGGLVYKPYCYQEQLAAKRKLFK